MCTGGEQATSCGDFLNACGIGNLYEFILVMLPLEKSSLFDFVVGVSFFGSLVSFKGWFLFFRPAV